MLIFIEVNTMIEAKKEEISIAKALLNIDNYFKPVDDSNGLYKSWEHCRNAFLKNRCSNSEDVSDYLCLHLAFYLASWGMYRGSSFLLQKDYKVHKDVIKIILDKKYESLWSVGVHELVADSKITKLIEAVGNEIGDAYSNTYPTEKEIDCEDVKNIIKSRKNHATDTLITKILLGTFGCVPAYDQAFTRNIKKYGIADNHYGNESIMALAKFYVDYYDILEKKRAELNRDNTVYTQMKIIDMIFC